MTAAAAATRHWQDLPGPRALPYFGSALALKRGKVHLQLEAWAREFGPLYRLQLGPRRLLVVGDHKLSAEVLRDRPDGFSRTQRLEEVAAEMGLTGGVFGANGDTWRRQRRMVMASFDPGHVKAYFPALQKVSQKLVERWQRAVRQGQGIDLQADLMRFTVDTIAGLAFGSEVDTLSRDDDVIQNHLDRIFPALSQRIFAVIPWWRIWPSRADRELVTAVREVMAAVQGFIAQARQRLQADPARRAHPANLLEAMLVAADEPDSGIDDRQVAGNVLTMLLAGEDTTANTLAWTIDLLWRHPAALARARDEVRAAVPAGGIATLEQLAGLDWVEACAHEAMRLKPVAPFLPLQAEHDTVVGDVAVPRGMIVMNLLRHDSVSEAHLPNAQGFDPARWLAEGQSAGQLGSSPKRIAMPFGAGPRMCPGRYLALLEMKIALATLFTHFDIEAVTTPDGAEAAEWLAFTMAPLGLTMRLRERLPAP